MSLTCHNIPNTYWCTLYISFVMQSLKISSRNDEGGAQLYHMDPSGTYLKFDAKAIGSGSEGAQQSLQESYHKSMTLKEATKSAMTILKQVSILWRKISVKIIFYCSIIYASYFVCVILTTFVAINGHISLFHPLFVHYQSFHFLPREIFVWY